ncbi:MAG: reverse transcriptase domain-containing protein [Candidatus Reddybacter sp.]
MITPLITPNELAGFLGTSLSKLTYVVYVQGVLAFYETFEIPKKNGGTRVINAPKRQLKSIQSRLKILLEKLYKPHPAAAAFIEGRGIVYNASKHVKRAAVFNIDLKGFYDQIHFGRVRGLLMAKPYSLRKDTAQLIAHICCVGGVLPQGAPTSPVISNMISRRLDKELSYLAKNNRAQYSRYADDITFSFITLRDNSIYATINGVEPHQTLVNIINENGFSINEEKTRLQTFKERQVVTGLKVNQKINVDRRFIRTTRAMIFSLNSGVDAANEKYKEKFKADVGRVQFVTYGRLNYIGMVKGRESSTYQSLAAKFNALDLNLKVTTAPEKTNAKLESQLHFSSYKEKSRLEKCIWVVSFEGMTELGDGELIQGSAFMIKGNRLVTASHIFKKAGNPAICIVYRIKEQNKKYKANVVSQCGSSDIAELEIQDESLPSLNYLNFAPDLEPKTGYKLSITGFPQLELGHDSVSIIPCTITNTLNISTLRYGEVDALISAGNSGGPVVNAYMQIVGMAVRGVDASYFEGEAQLEGRNAFVSAKHFTHERLDEMKQVFEEGQEVKTA